MGSATRHDGAQFVLGDRYVVSGVLGRGAVGEVLAAHDTVLRRDVAVKVWRSVGTDPRGLERVAREARAAGLVESPAVVTVLDADVRSQPPYLVMERLSGVTWADALREAVPGDATSTAVLVDVLGALAAAHAVGVVHRDVKPANVLLTDDGRAKLGDFGIAALADGTALTGTGDVLGSAPYLAPERLEGAAASGACDVWSVGVMAYEAFTGHRPYSGETPVLTAMAVVRGGHPPLARVRPDLPPDVLAAVDASLDRDPARRPSPQGLRAVLEATLPPSDGLGDPMLEAFVASAAGRVGRTSGADAAAASPGTTVLVPLPVLGAAFSAAGPASPSASPAPSRRLRAGALAAAVLVVGGAGVAAVFGLDADPGGAAAAAAWRPVLPPPASAVTMPVAPSPTVVTVRRIGTLPPGPTTRSGVRTRVRTVVVRSTVTPPVVHRTARAPRPKPAPGRGAGQGNRQGNGKGGGNDKGGGKGHGGKGHGGGH